MRNQPVWLPLIPTLLTLLMGWLDDVTGWEVSLFIFYAVPIVHGGLVGSASVAGLSSR
jgi:hypothetical protein